MNEVSYKSMSAASFNQDNISKLFSDPFNRIPEATFTTPNNYTIADVETKEIVNLKRTVNRLEKNITFIQHEHNQMLRDLQNQIDKLREENQDLQFQLVMRSNRYTNDISQIEMHPIDKNDLHNPVTVDSESLSNEIQQLKLALEKEKVINSELIQKLKVIETTVDDFNQEVMANTGETPNNLARSGDEIEISSNIRISLEPLTLSLYHEGSGQYIKNANPSREDCEVIIKALLENPRHHSTKGNSEASFRSFSVKRNVVIPIVRKPLQIMKQYPRNSASVKLNPLNGTICSKPVELISNHHKLLPPMVAHKSYLPNIDTQRSDIGKQLENDSPQLNIHPGFGDKGAGVSLPALPRPTDHNQADKQRRLQMIQKKRLDQFNSKH